MGVPKFYRWLSERYPCLSQVIKEHQIPEFDNLYLDMNGIIHPCSHPNDDDPHFRITEAEIFKNIFNYIEVLFRIIKPKKNFFMAVDGCAPRAKMNQQRSRRFRTAKDAEDNIRKAMMKGQTLPTADRFDSNCITPGTEFMARLQEQLQYFVNKKISTDTLWQNCTVYLSGHDVPGEGEHKIMDFIRYEKSQPGYNTNTRHCLYGLDADLIILGMVTHEPHFALLREEVRYGKAAKRMIQPEEQTFHLLHLSLLREYLDFEFRPMQPNLHFTYNLERIIDDWVILGFLVGNDFVPHLPNLHINHDALPYLFGIYKEFLVTADGYLNDGGYLNIHRLKKFFEVLSKFDRTHFEDIYADLKWLESKGAGNMLHKDKQENTTPNKRFSELLKLTDQEGPNRSFSPYRMNTAEVSGLDDTYGSPSPEKPVRIATKSREGDEDVEVEDEETFELEFKQHKRHYYMEKYDMDIVEDEEIRTICFEYVRALQWISHYYFNGLQSWSWYYPYHYSPYVSDVAALDVRELVYDMAYPFKPFEQLLAVLPSASRKLLPQAFQTLMIEEDSAIIDFYPLEFRTDLNGKQQDWEAVVLIPFINETRLMNAMNPNYSRLTDEEKQRNSFGDCFKYNYDKTLNFVYPTAFPDVFEDINVCKAKVERLNRDLYRMDPLQIKKGLMKGTLTDIYYHGFPTMKHLKLEASLRKASVKVFQQNSRNNNMVIKIIAPQQENLETLAKKLVGEMCFVEWPYMAEALAISICNDSVRYYLDQNDELVSKLIKDAEFSHVKAEMKTTGNHLMNRRGIEVGAVQILVEAKLLLGQRYICGQNGSVRLEKEWKTASSVYPYQTVIQNLNVHPPEVEIYDSIGTLYPPGAIVFMMSSTHYGCSGEVIETDMENCRVRATLKVTPEPDFSGIIGNYGSLSVHYIPDRTVAQRLSISPHLLGRITGNVYVVPDADGDRDAQGQNIGLKLKYSGQNKEVLGFARRTDQGWTYSPLTIGILNEYMKKFPEVFESLGKMSHQDRYNLSSLLPGKSNAYLDDVLAFLRSQKCHGVQPVRCGSNILDNPIVEEIKCAVEMAKGSLDERKVVKVKVKPHLLFRPTEQFGKLSPDPATEFLLFDRVVNIQYGISVPIGLRGTIIGFHEVLSEENDKDSATELRHEVLFDETFLNEKGESLKRGYFMSGYSLLNISYGQRKENEKNGVPLSPPSSFQSKISHAPVTVSASPGGARTPGSSDGSQRHGQHTSPYNNVQLTPRNNNQRSPYTSSQGTPRNTQQQSMYGNQRAYSAPSSKSHNKNENLVSPDYWLKGNYAGKNNNYHTPQPQQPRKQILQHSPANQQNNGGTQQQSGGARQKRYQQGNGAKYAQGNEKYQHGNDNNDFLNMWTELQKNENAANKSSPAAASPSTPQETIDKNATAMLQQMLKINDQPSTPTTTILTNPRRVTPPTQQTTHKKTPPHQQQPGLLTQPKHTGILSNPNIQKQSTPSHSKAKGVQISPSPPTFHPQPAKPNQQGPQYSHCEQNSPYNNNQRTPLLNFVPQQQNNMQNMTMPPATGYLQNNQGTYSLFGMPQNTPPSSSQTRAQHTAQAAIFQQLCGNSNMSNLQYPYNVLSQVQGVQGVTPISHGVSPINFAASPQQMGGHHISSYQFPSPMMQTQGLYQTPQSYIQQQQGFQTPQQFTQGSRSNTNLSSHARQNDGHMKQSSFEPTMDEKQRMKSNPFIPHQVLMKNTTLRPGSDADNEIKGILGIKDKNQEKVMWDEKPPNTGECSNTLLDTKALSDDDRLKSLLGINSVNKGVGDGSCRKRDIDPSQARHPPATDTALLPTPPMLAAGSPANQTVDNSRTQNKKSQILLAPSFFGPKKKSI